MKKKVLLVCCNNLANGGIQAVIMSIVRNLNDKYDFDAISFTEGKQYYTDEFLKYGNIYYFKKYSPRNILSRLFSGFIEYYDLYNQSRKFFKSHSDYDVVHCHNYFNAAPILKAAKEAGIKIRVSHSHNVASVIKIKNPLNRVANKFKSKQLNKYSTNMIACSKAAGQYLFESNNVKVVNNAINLEKFNPEKYDNSHSNIIRFAHVGLYSYQKNQLFLLDVFKEFLNLNSNATLKLVGSGDLYEDVANKIIELNLSDKVSMLPSDSNIPEIYAKSDLVIFPSTFEGLGISLIEAQAMGLRCYVSEVIQPEADLGLCKKLQLSWGAKKWAEFIYDDINENGYEKHFVDMSSYDITNVIQQYDNIYSGK